MIISTAPTNSPVSMTSRKISCDARMPRLSNNDDGSLLAGTRNDPLLKVALLVVAREDTTEMSVSRRIRVQRFVGLRVIDNEWGNAA